MIICSKTKANTQKTVEEQEKENIALLKKYAGIVSGYETKLLDLEKYIKSRDHLRLHK